MDAFAELVGNLIKKELDDYSPGRRWVRKAETLLDGVFQCPLTWPHEVFIVEAVASWTGKETVKVRDAGDHEYTFRRNEFGLFYERQAKTRHERIRDQLTR